MKSAEWHTNDAQMGAWERIKAALANDWEQTKRDMGSQSARDLDQDVDDTVKQALGTEDAFENREQAFRFGYAAQVHYRDEYPTWNADLESRLRSDYDGDFDADREYILHAYDFRPQRPR